MSAKPIPRLRPAALDDAVSVTRFLAGLGLVMPDGDEAAKAHWHGLWQDNPALPAHGPDPALGWVLDDGAGIVGFFGNVPQVSYFDGRPVPVSSARAWGVDPVHRAETPRLCEAFFGQKGVDLVLISSASAPAGRRCLEFGAARMPQPGYDQILYWVMDAGRFIRAGLKKKGRGGAAAWWGGAIGGMALNARMRLGGRRPFAPLDGISVNPIARIDEDFDNLWAEKRDQVRGQLLACRSAETLRWYFGLGQGRDQTRVVCRHRDGLLQGYAVVVREDAPAIGLKRIKIADMLVAGDDPVVVDALLTGAFEYGLAKGCHVLELIGLPASLRSQAMRHKPYSRPMPTFPFFYKALSAELEAPLAAVDGWYVTAFDGDTALL